MPAPTAPVAGNTVASLAPIPATAIAAAAHRLADAVHDNANHSRISEPDIQEHLVNGVLQSAPLTGVAAGPTAAEVEEFEAKFAAASAEHAATEPEEESTVEYVTKAEFDALTARINTFNTRSPQKI